MVPDNVKVCLTNHPNSLCQPASADGEPRDSAWQPPATLETARIRDWHRRWFLLREEGELVAKYTSRPAGRRISGFDSLD